MKTRLITAGVAIVIFMTLVILGEITSVVIAVAVSLANSLMCGEYLSAKKLNINIKVFLPCMLYSLLIPLLSYTRYRYIPIFLFALTLCVIAVVFHDNTSINDIIFAFAGVTLLSASMSFFVIRSCYENRFTAFWVFLIVGIPWLADSAAYFVGSALGKHKLCPNISPKKSVEGAIGGVVVGTASSVIIGMSFMLIYGNVTVNLAVLLIIGLLNSVISIFGDLLFSVIKRSCNIKDFGSIMPGHGGILDRFDSVIFCTPVIFIFSQYFVIIA